MSPFYGPIRTANLGFGSATSHFARRRESGQGLSLHVKRCKTAQQRETDALSAHQSPEEDDCNGETPLAPLRLQAE